MKPTRQLAIFLKVLSIVAVLSGAFALNISIFAFSATDSNLLVLVAGTVFSVIGFAAGILAFTEKPKGWFVCAVYFWLQVISVQVKSGSYGFPSGLAFWIAPGAGNSGVAINVFALVLAVLFTAAYQAFRSRDVAA